ncbi:MAG TPA: acyl-CoA desaturase, partial [Wenzhouxiangellaceae bacterium]|nr:acyl-CoA desaturase [Wenzhouxiangellaceae bacterium]
MLKTVFAWFDTSQLEPGTAGHRVDITRVVPFIALHLACLAVFWVGVSPIAAAVCIASYLLRMFAITAFYHR